MNCLKRTGELEEKIDKKQPHGLDQSGFDASKHSLRLIPIRELELFPKTMEQTPNY